MEDREKWNRAEPGQSRPRREMKDGFTQTDSKVQGHFPRLSKVNLFTLLSLWMEMFPQEQPEEDDSVQTPQRYVLQSPPLPVCILESRGAQSWSSRATVLQIRRVGLVVVRDGKVVGLHCSGAELHAGQSAIIQHGAHLASCQLYFSRRPCATCLKMIINAGVSQISFWPGDPEISLLKSPNHSCPHPDGPSHYISEEAELDAVTAEKLKSNSCSHICVQLQPLTPGLVQFIDETSRESDFMVKITDADPELNRHKLFNRERRRHLGGFSKHFLVSTPQQHKEILIQMGLDNFCTEPYFSDLRQKMRELVEVLATVAAGLPQQLYGFYREELATSQRHQEEVSQEVARHCIIQARLLAYRTEDPKVGVGAVIWAKGQSVGCRGTGRLYLVSCGYNAYPAGSKYAEYPGMDTKQGDPQRRKYRYIVHAEQNALTFRTQEIRAEDPTMLFVTKCPCDECVPLIRGAGITHIYTSDQDRDKDKGDISYLRFSSLKDISRFTWQKSPLVSSAPSPHLANGYSGEDSRWTEDDSRRKKLCTRRSGDAPIS